jgi:hypothetical protein
MLFMAHANNTDCGLRARDGPTIGGYALFVWGMACSENGFTLFWAMP